MSHEKKGPRKNVIICYSILVLGFELMCAEVKIKIDFGLIRLVEYSDISFRPCKIWGEGGFDTNLTVSCRTFVKLRPDLWFS